MTHIFVITYTQNDTNGLKVKNSLQLHFPSYM